MMLQQFSLSSLARVFSGGGAPQDKAAFTATGHPFIRAGSLPKLLNGANEESLEKIESTTAEKYGLNLFPIGTVLFAKSGMSATKGHIYRLRQPSYVVNHLSALVPHEPGDSAFLGHALQRFPPMALIKDPAYPSIRLGDIGNMKIPAPQKPSERWRIAEVLDQADALRAKRRTTLAQLDTLTQSIFLGLVGSTDANNWPEPEIASLAKDKPNAIRTGPFGSQLLHSEFVDSGIAVLGIDNAVQNKFVWARPRFITEEKYRQLQRYKIFPGDVLITIMGTCGCCAVVPNEIPTAINTKHLCCISLNQSRCLPLYLQACFLLHPKVQHRLGIRERGAVMPGLNMQIIKELSIPLPPLDLQSEFARRVAAVEKLKSAHRASLAELDTLFASLQHRAFQGEL